MPSVYAAHPHLTDGATAVDPTGKVVTAGLYLDGNGPHPINSFGCTICHGGQGSGTDFTYASHEPNDLEEKEHWEEKYHWHEIHHWDEPMLPTRFLESSCLKCHHQVTDVPQADKLQAGYQRIVKYGCTGCHTIGGEGSFGPDLTDERQVGPNLGHLGVEGLAGLGPQVDQEPARLPPRHPDAPLLRPDQQRRQGGLAQEPRRDPRDHPLPVQQSRPRRPSSSILPPRATRRGARSSSSRRAAWPATAPALDQRDPTRAPRQPDPARSPRAFPEPVRIRQGRLRPEPLEHRGQVPVAGPGLSLAGQLDQGPRGVPPQEPDAQRPALVPGRRPTSPPGSSRSRATGRAGRPSRPSTPPRSRKGSTSWSSSTSPRGASPSGASRSRSRSARSTAS